MIKVRSIISLFTYTYKASGLVILSLSVILLVELLEFGMSIQLRPVKNIEIGLNYIHIDISRQFLSILYGVPPDRIFTDT